MAVEETRLGIPLFFALDVLHGFRTIFPIPLAEAGAFDPALWEETARLAAAEAVAAGLDLTFAPMLDVARDPRWGRIAEGPGEDPYVAARFAEAKVRGFQGADLSGLAATPKHFAAYGASAAGRDYAAVDISDRTLAEVYLPPFRAAVDAGALAAHARLHRPRRRALDRPPRPPHRHPARGLGLRRRRHQRLRRRRRAHQARRRRRHPRGRRPRAQRRRRHRHDVARLPDAACPRRSSAGSSPRPPSTPPSPASSRSRSASASSTTPTAAAPAPTRRAALDRAAAAAAATRSIVLLKNEGALPLPPAPRRIALLGPLADAPGEMLGPWAGAGRGEEAIGVLAGLRAALPDARIVHVAGVSIEGDAPDGIDAAVAAARAADHVILAIGEAAWMSGEAASRARIDLPGRQAALAAAVFATGRPVTVLLFSGRPIAMPEVFDAAAAVLACWFPGSDAGDAIAALLTGAEAPSAGLPVTWPRDVGQVPIAYSARTGGRPENPHDHYTSKYLDLPNSPQFPFGHGLTYTRFRTGPPEAEVTPEGVAVSLDVANTGSRAGVARLLLFIHDPLASIARPTLELRDFAAPRPRRRRDPPFPLPGPPARRLRLPRRRRFGPWSSRVSSRSTSVSPPTPPTCARRASSSPDVRPRPRGTRGPTRS